VRDWGGANDQTILGNKLEKVGKHCARSRYGEAFGASTNTLYANYYFRTFDARSDRRFHALNNPKTFQFT